MRIGNALNALGNSIAGGVEQRTSDYEANSTNVGKIWMRTDLSTATVKTIVKLSDKKF